MIYSESEIVVAYKQAKLPQQQIRILADLNLTTVHEITVVLAKHNAISNRDIIPVVTSQKQKCTSCSTENKSKSIQKNRRDPNEIDLMYKLKSEGYTYAAISNIIGCSKGTVYYYLKLRKAG